MRENGYNMNLTRRMKGLSSLEVQYNELSHEDLATS